MNVLLISANRERMPFPVAPLGLAYLASSLRKEGHDPLIIDLCFEKNVEETLAEYLNIFKPGLIGISIRNIDNLTNPDSISYMPQIKETVDLCKSLSSAQIIVGGSGFSLIPDEILKYLGLKYGIIGEGEAALPQIATKLERGYDFLDIAGLISINSGAVRIVTPVRYKDINDIPDPARDMLENELYLEHGGMGNLQTKRGCPYSCIYCTYPYLEGKLSRLRSTERIADEMENMINKYNIDYIYFVDNIFNYPAEHAETLCKIIIKREIKARWASFMHPSYITEKSMDLMIQAGCHGVELGSDSGSEKILQNLRKNTTIHDIKKASKICADKGVNSCHYLILGGPGETKDTLQETFEFFHKLAPTAIIPMVGIRIYPNTPLEDIAIEEGIIKRGESLLKPKFYVSREIKDYIFEIVTDHALSQSNWIVPGLNINISKRLMEMARKQKLRGPLWDLAIKIKRSRIKPLES